MKAMLAVGTLTVFLGLAACQQRGEQADVTKAQADASKSVAEARSDASATIADATRQESASQATLEHATSKAEEDVALTVAKGNYKVATEKCEALTSDQRAMCKRKADADLEAAQAHAHQDRAVTDPKP